VARKDKNRTTEVRPRETSAGNEDARSDAPACLPDVLDTIAEQGASQHHLKKHFTAIHIYRHLLANLRAPKDNARSSINGARAAAVLARLRISIDLTLTPIPQKQLAFELDMNPSDLGQTLGEFLDEGLVALAPAQSKREKHYILTAAGDAALEKWIMDRYAPRDYLQAFVNMNPDTDKMLNLLEALQRNLMASLSR
jgi:DNA-binding MarR family transcriptional regulator